MGNGWREWIVGLCEMCAAGALCDLLCGEGPSRRAVKWIMGLSLMNAFLEAADFSREEIIRGLEDALRLAEMEIPEYLRIG